MQYFDNNENLKSKRRLLNLTLLGKEYFFISDNGVFSKNEIDYGSIALIKILLKKDLHGHILDMGCGYGTIGIVLAKNYPNSHITMVDINIRACELANENVKKQNLTNAEVIISDQFSKVDQKFDYIVTNPPIKAGKKVIYSIFNQSYEHLNTNGSLFLVIRKDQGAKTAQRYIETIFDNCTLEKKDKGFYIYEARKNKMKTEEDF